MSEVFWYAQTGYRHLLLSGVFERYPNLKYVITESGCAWAGPLLKQLDRIHANVQRGVVGEITYDPSEWGLKAPPSEYARRNCFYGASFPSKADLDGIDAVGEDNVLWGNDYPHYEGTYPYTLESLRLTFADMPEARRRKVLGQNAAKLYKFDLDALKPLAAKYGPTPSQVEQPLPRDAIPRDSLCYLFANALETA
jgi:predicted TIM-barrel fold metal-dependent hydrolase